MHEVSNNATTFATKKRKKAPRLNHTKSKAGCMRCKARRVKCDERHPICGGCDRHEVECVWADVLQDVANGSEVALIRPSLIPQTDSFTKLTPPLSDTSASPSTPGSITSESPERRLEELNLLHSFMTRTVYTMPSSNHTEVRDVWINQAPEMAFKHLPLLYGIFAISAFHLAILQPQHVQKYVALAQEYRSLCMRMHRASISTITAANADFIALTSVLMSICTVRDLGAQAFELSGRRREQGSTPAATQYQRLIFTQGTHATVGMSWEGGACTDPSSAIRVLIEHLPKTWDQKQQERQAAGQPLAVELKLPAGCIESLQLILAPRLQLPTTASHGQPSYVAAPMAEELQDVALYQMYEDAIEKCSVVLRSVVSRDYAPPSMAQLTCTVANTLPPRFNDLVLHGRPRAMIILAHLWACLKYCQELWWIGDCCIKDPRDIAAELGREWSPYLEWPLRWPLEKEGG